MTYILIVFWVVGVSPMTTQEFNSSQNCEAAKQWIIKNQGDPLTRRTPNVTCMVK